MMKYLDIKDTAMFCW